MDTNNFIEKTLVKNEIDLLNDSIRDYIDVLGLLYQTESLDYYEYDYEYSQYSYLYSVNNNKENKDNTKEFILDNKNVLLGKICLSNDLIDSKASLALISKINEKLLMKNELIKQRKNNDSSLNIYILHDPKSKNFSAIIYNDLSALFNANIIISDSIINIKDIFDLKSSKNILIYLCSDHKTIKEDEEILKTLNDFMIVYGPNEHELSLLCGKLHINNYITYDDYNNKNLEQIIKSTKNLLLNKFENKNNIISFSGISGGVGCTTISMNFANILAKEEASQNILFIDLSLTKAISNLFLTQNPLPEKTIVDLINSGEFDISNNLNNGLVKVKENFYAINGIQKHIDKDYLEKDVFIEKLLDYLQKASEYFSVIIIDTGVFEATNLKTTMYDISNDIDLIIEMNLPNVSKLKTLHSLVKRAGLKDKLSFIVNRFDSQSALSINDAISILNMSDDEKIFFQFKISNDFPVIGKCWNNCELVSNVHVNHAFTQELKKFIIQKKLIKNNEKENKDLSFFSRYFGKKS